jgi:hypothetical protein
MTEVINNRRVVSFVTLLTALVFASTGSAQSVPPAWREPGVLEADAMPRPNTRFSDSTSNSTCPGDINGDGTVTIDEILRAVNSALNGCPAGPPVDVSGSWMSDQYTCVSSSCDSSVVNCASVSTLPVCQFELTQTGNSLTDNAIGPGSACLHGTYFGTVDDAGRLTLSASITTSGDCTVVVAASFTADATQYPMTVTTTSAYQFFGDCSPYAYDCSLVFRQRWTRF